ncbi:MAG: hypothetical protein M1826_005994 [Phylliscum demangeonii]|nr:MAG: hypothetical protein M1826_005994 [Phylliscum demangeonii]
MDPKTDVEMDVEMDRDMHPTTMTLIQDSLVKMEGRLETITELLDGMEERMVEQSDTMEEGRVIMEGRFQRMEGLQRNWYRFHDHERIIPIRVDKPWGFSVPYGLPKTVGALLRLGSPENVPKLAELIRFYEIDGWKDFDVPKKKAANDGDHIIGQTNTTDEDTSKPVRSLEDAVRRFPTLAIRALVEELGLVSITMKGICEKRVAEEQRAEFDRERRRKKRVLSSSDEEIESNPRRKKSQKGPEIPETEGERETTTTTTRPELSVLPLRPLNMESECG